MRVYELAKELGLSSKDLVVLLKEAGFVISSHMSVLSAHEVDKAYLICKGEASAQSNNADELSVAPIKIERLQEEKNSAAPHVNKEVQKSAQVTERAAAEGADNKLKEPSKNSSDDNSQIKKVDMTNPSKNTRQHSGEPAKAPFKKVHLSSHDDQKKKHQALASASFQASQGSDDFSVVREAPFLDEQIMEKLGDGPVLTNAKGQEKFTRIFAEKRRSSTSKRRRRYNRGQHVEQDAAPAVIEEFEISAPIRLGDLASSLNKPASDLILNLLKRGMVCNINNVLQPDIIKGIVEGYGIKANMVLRQATAEAAEEQMVATRLKKNTSEGLDRAPIVVVMGHVDHGKTTLLDYVRKKNVAGSEKGGITQHLGAYEVATKQGQIVFLDTPGHEAFSYIRRQGSKVTDIAILVVAADDGIKPQTVEAIKHAKEAEVPIIVAINKIDKIKSPAAIDTIKRQLSQYDLMAEDWGGQVICVPISAKTGEGVEHLLEMIILQAQMMELKARVDVPAKVFILESHVEKGFGPVATGIVIEGTLNQGDYFACGEASGKVRLLVDSHAKRLTKAAPSIPVKIVGFNSLEEIGEWLTVISQQEYAKHKNNPELLDAQKDSATQSKETLQQFNNQHTAGAKQQRALNLIIKTDTRGSKEALAGLIEKLARDNKEINCPIRIIMSGIGDISEGDIDLALNTDSFVIGLHVKTERNAFLLAKEKNVHVYQHDIIYHLIEFLQEELYKRREIKSTWEKVAELVVRKVFDIKGLGVIAGCYVREGVVAKGNKAICMRAGKAVGEGKISSLQRDKKTVKEVHAGYECGFICDSYSEWQEDDVVVIMREEKAQS